MDHNYQTKPWNILLDTFHVTADWSSHGPEVVSGKRERDGERKEKERVRMAMVVPAASDVWVGQLVALAITANQQEHHARKNHKWKARVPAI